jgi:hypothetical protein
MYCIHIPIQSSIQFGFKLANGNNRLLRERANLEKGNGYHWVDLAQKFAAGKFNYNTLSMAAINYPNIAEVANDELTTLNFGFPYVKNKYCETPSYIAAQIAGLIDHVDEIDATNISTAFTVTDIVGNVEFTSYAVAPESPNVDGAESELKSDIFTNNFDCFEEKFSTLVEPLFNLPTTLPVSAWKGHIPFLFVLFKLLRPKSYVELGVHNGGSLIAACTAAKSYNLTTKIYGVDAWEGDEHAGYYQGDQIFNQLKTHLDSNFRNVELIRNYFADARRGFSASSIDLLHIDGLHTYEAVREDFTTWFGAMAPTGVIMFHDICVFERGFGVHRFWAELKKVFKTIEFHHSHGLGVLFLDPTDSRIAPLVELASNSHAINFYRNLTSAIADTLPERMGYFDLVGVISQRDQKLSETTRQLADCNSQIANYNCKISELESEIIALRNSRSWRITAPLRAMKGYK